MEVVVFFILAGIAVLLLPFHIEIGMLTIPIAIFFGFMAYYSHMNGDKTQKSVYIIIAIIIVIFSVTIGTYSISELFNLIFNNIFH